MQPNNINKEFIKIAISISNPLSSFNSYTKNKYFIHPHTRNKVKFESLPIHTQKFIKSKWLSLQPSRDKNLFLSIESDLQYKNPKENQLESQLAY